MRTEPFLVFGWDSHPTAAVILSNGACLGYPVRSMLMGHAGVNSAVVLL